jgi:hypothetical protein
MMHLVEVLIKAGTMKSAVHIVETNLLTSQTEDVGGYGLHCAGKCVVVSAQGCLPRIEHGQWQSQDQLNS